MSNDHETVIHTSPPAEGTVQNNQSYPPPQGGADNKRFPDPQGSQYRDKCWMVFFIVHLVIMLALGGLFGSDLITAMKTNQNNAIETDQNVNTTSTSTDTMDTTAINMLIKVLIIDTVAGSLFGAFWLWIIRTVPIVRLLWVYAFMELVLVIVVGGLLGNQLLAFIILISFFLTVAGICCCWKRSIPFAEAMIKPVIQAISENKSVVYLAYGLSIVQAIWAVLWSFIFLAVLYRLDPTLSDDGSHVPQFILLISFYWTSEVVKNIGHVTTSGTIASWWLNPGSPQFNSSLRRAMTTSFGSICYGSLLVAIIKAIRAMLNAARESAYQSDNAASAIIIACVDCIMSCIESLLEYFNMYAYTFVAIYGYDYLKAAKSTMNLFKSSGFTMIINDNIVGMVLFLGILLGGFLTVLLSLALVLKVFPPLVDLLTPVLIIGFLIGFFLTSLVLNTVESGVATTFVLWAYDPELLKSTRREYYMLLETKKQEIYDDTDDTD